MSKPQQPDYESKLGALPHRENDVQVGALSFISFILLCLLYVDILFSFKRKTSWVPGRWLLLGSFTLTLLQLTANTVPYADYNLDRLLEMNRVSDYGLYFYGNILIQSRVAFCLVLCFVIPQVANDRGWNLFVDMVSLFLNASITITKMVYEILMIKRYCKEKLTDSYDYVCHGYYYITLNVGYFEGRNVMLIICTVIMCWCLCSAIFASISLRDTLNWSLSMFSNACGKKQVANLKESTASGFTEPQIKEKLVEVCLMSRACQPGYIIARSPLASSVFLIGSFCCVLVILDLRKAYIHFTYELYFPTARRSSYSSASVKRSSYSFAIVLEYFKYLFVPLQAILVFSLWMVIFWRWLTCVYYHSACACDGFGIRSWFKCGLKNVFHSEEFWVQSLLNFQVDKIISSEPEFSHLKLLQRIIIRMKLYKIVSLLIFFQKLTILCSKVPWFLGSLFVALLGRIILGPASYDTLYFIPSHQQDTTVNERDILRVGQSRVISMRDFQKLHKTLLFMQCQTPNGVWAENLSWMRCLNDQFQKEIKRGSECMELKWLLAHSQTEPTNSASLVSKYLSRGNLNDSGNFYMGYSSIKITIASLLTVMVELSYVFEHYFSTTVTLQGAGNISFVETYTKGCTQAWEVVGLAESLVKKPDIVGRAGDTLFKQLLPKSMANCTRFHDADFFSLIKNGVEDLKRVGRDAFVREFNSSSKLEGFDSRCWAKAIGGKNLWKVCNLLDECIDAAQQEEDSPLHFLLEVKDAIAVLIDFAVKALQSFEERLACHEVQRHFKYTQKGEEVLRTSRSSTISLSMHSGQHRRIFKAASLLSHTEIITPLHCAPACSFRALTMHHSSPTRPHYTQYFIYGHGRHSNARIIEFQSIVFISL